MTVAHSGPAEEEQRKVNASIERLQKAGDSLVERFQKKCRQLEAAELQNDDMRELLRRWLITSPWKSDYPLLVAIHSDTRKYLDDMVSRIGEPCPQCAKEPEPIGYRLPCPKHK